MVILYGHGVFHIVYYTIRIVCSIYAHMVTHMTHIIPY